MRGWWAADGGLFDVLPVQMAVPPEKPFGRKKRP
jgi:hypothetical protein